MRYYERHYSIPMNYYGVFENVYDHKLVNTEKYIWEYMFIKIESKDI